MINHIWSVLCSQSIIDQTSNNVSLIGIIEQLNVGGSPLPETVPIRLEVVSLWVRAETDRPSRGRARIYFVTPSGTGAELPEYDVDLSTYQRIRTRAFMTGLPVRESGRHYFRVEFKQESQSKWEKVADIPLQIVHRPPETQKS